MKLDYLKRKIRGWLPPQPSNLSSKIKHYSVPIAVGLAVTIFSLSLFAISSNFFAGSSITAPPVDTSVGNTDNQNSTTVTSQQNSTITEEQALNIAMPIIVQYARENNRTITNVTAESALMADYGLRGGPTFEQILTKGKVTRYYPVWVVRAAFQWTKPQPEPVYDANGTIVGNRWPSNATWINGFDVAIWADNGQVASAGPQGVY
ncbi:MAG: hypothetical protein NWE99_10045 [Candidatus Bathyarchaeota archaeon]|nr:hypothetical protein [Candidatus Bathyarchaeota archaeon]